MTSYDEARERILEIITTLEVVKQPLMDCIDQVLAEDIHSTFDLPQVASSGPDGYAVKSADIVAAGTENPATLQIIESIRAGILPKKAVVSGTAARIMTGAVLPKGADCVVRFEDTDEPGNKSGPNPGNPAHVKIFVSAAPGAGIRTVGSNSTRGSLIVPKGTVIGPAQIAALTAHGVTVLKVIRRPVIAVISTGDELVRAGKPLSPGKSYDCNSAALASLISHYGGIPKVLGIARDNMESVEAKIKRGMAADAIITSGGASKGDYDLIRLMLEKKGKVIFSTIKMGPGASFAFGLLDRTSESGKDTSIPLFALAGPPSGCMINFETLVRPALLKMQGYTKIHHTTVEAEALDSSPDKKRMAIVKWTTLRKIEDDIHVQLNSSDDIGMFASIAAANSLTIIPENVSVNAGDRIRVLPLDWRRDG